VDVLLPRFKFQTRYDLAQTLAKMGMPDAFDATKADFSGMDGARDLALGKVIHQAVIEVNELGSEAAAATAITMFATTMAPRPPEKIEIFRADRPFLFLIVHNPTGSILFLGRVANPPPVPAPVPAK
jgi:serpin B